MSLLSFDAEFAAGASTGMIVGEPHVLDPMVSRWPWGMALKIQFFFQVAEASRPQNRASFHLVGSEDA